MMQMHTEDGQNHGRFEPNGLPGIAGAAARVDRVTVFRISEAAELLGVSADTVRRWVDAGRLAATRDEHGHRVIDGVDLAGFARSQGGDPEERAEASSARNRLRGIVTAVVKDTVMAQVDIQAGPFRVVSLMSREAVDELDLRVGSVAVAVIKSTNVVVERAVSGRTRA
jgi:molybdopterin-binding protein